MNAATSISRGAMGSTAGCEVLDWVKLIFEIIIGIVLTAFHIFKDFLEIFVPPKSKSLDGLHILVTGAARGLGREICLILAQEGSKVTCVDVMDGPLKETAKLCNEINESCATAILCDVTNRTKVNNLVKTVPPVDILINNAGIVQSAGILEATDQQIEKIMNVNVMAHYWTIRAFLPSMIERGSGHIVAIASAAAFTAAANIAPYTASKYAVTGLMSSLHEEFRWYHPKIKTTSIHPFFISPPASSVEHWKVNSRLPDVTAAYVAEKTVKGLKMEKVTVTIPAHLYYLLFLLQILPQAAGELWRDMFYAKIHSLENGANRANGKKSL